ncbi:MAG TPA: DUF262 domain-containing protein, partial [Gemmatimonadaceae bacterium]
SKPLVAQPLTGFYGYLLDGQQRLTSLSKAIQGTSQLAIEERAFFDIENQVFVLGGTSKIVRNRLHAADPLLVPLSELIGFATEGEIQAAIQHVIDALRERDKLGKRGIKEADYRARLAKVAGMLRRTALCEEFKDDSESNAVELFSRLNRGGTKLTAGEVEAARLSSAATRKILEPMRAVIQEREMRALGFNFVFLIRTLMTVHRHNSSFSKLSPDWAGDAGQIEQSWRKTESALRFVVAFLRTEMGWTTRRWLPSTAALIPLVYLIAQTSTNKFTDRERDLARRYLLITGLRSAFRGSTETTVNTYVSTVRNTTGDRPKRLKAMFDRIPRALRHKIAAEDVSAATGLHSPLMQVYYTYALSIDAHSWPSGRSLRNVLSESLTGDPIAVHHIFPKAYLATREVSVMKSATMANYALLSQADNGKINDEGPADVWRTLSPSLKTHAAAQLFYHANERLYEFEAFNEFLSERAKEMAKRLNEYLQLG